LSLGIIAYLFLAEGFLHAVSLQKVW